MKNRMTKFLFGLMSVLLVLSFSTMNVLAQQRKSGGGGSRKPANVQQRPAAKPASKPAAKPSSAQRPTSKPTSVQKPANVQKPSATQKSVSKPDAKGQTAGKKTNISNNNVNVDKSRGDVNINVDNSKDIKVRNTKNTVVRHNNYRPPYSRPPYHYGGYSYRCYHPYYYHPYRPFVWGPRWHPWGFFIATLAATAIIVSFADADLPAMMHSGEYFVWNNGLATVQNQYMRSGPSEMDYGPTPMSVQTGEYYYDEGVFYLKGDGGYTVVAAPLGGIIKTLPEGYETVDLDEAGKVKNYYYGGAFYEKTSNGYKVVAPTSGVVVSNLAEGGEEVKIADVTYVKLGETYFQPIQQDGKNKYEVVDVEADK
jgi:hypothetical protein